MVSRSAADTNDDESKTAVVGSKRSTISNQSHRKRRRRREVISRDLRDFVPAGTSFSEAQTAFDALTNSPSNMSPIDSSTTYPPDSGTTSDIASDLSHSNQKSQEPKQNLGRNRLTTGFYGTRVAQDNPTAAASVAMKRDKSTSSRGNSFDDAIEISDDDEEMQDSEGGMVINVQGPEEVVTLSDDGEIDEDESDREPHFPHNSDQKVLMKAQVSLRQDQTTQSRPPTVLRTLANSKSKVRLADLDPEDLENEIKYTFFLQDRDQIDLSRFVYCLSCASEGHLTRHCPTKSMSHFALPTLPTGDDAVKLWISCCVCASKDHLVGDCPSIAPTRAGRWSLLDIDPKNIINMSLESGTRRMEEEAESQGMRPQGLQIRGRAGLHHAGQPTSTPVSSRDSDDEPFLRPSINPTRRPHRPNRGRPPRGPAGRNDRGPRYR